MLCGIPGSEALFNANLKSYSGDDRRPLIFIRTLPELDTKKLNFWQGKVHGKEHLFSHNIDDEKRILESENKKIAVETKPGIIPTSEWTKSADDKRLAEIIDDVARSIKSMDFRYFACLSKRGPWINQNINSSKKFDNSMFKINETVFQHFEIQNALCSYFDDDYKYLFCRCERYTFVA